MLGVWDADAVTAGDDAVVTDAVLCVVTCTWELTAPVWSGLPLLIQPLSPMPMATTTTAPSSAGRTYRMGLRRTRCAPAVLAGTGSSSRAASCSAANAAGSTGWAYGELVGNVSSAVR